MSNERIGPFLLTGTAAQNAVLLPAATKLKAVINGGGVKRIKDVRVEFKSAAFLASKFSGSFVPRGFVPNANTVWMHEKVDRYQAAKTFAHEVGHILDAQWLTAQQRDDLCALMDPRPTNWQDRTVDGQQVGYAAAPGECFACYVSAAFMGYPEAHYTEFYERVVAKTNWSKLAASALKDYGAAEPPPETAAAVARRGM